MRIKLSLSALKITLCRSSTNLTRTPHDLVRDHFTLGSRRRHAHSPIYSLSCSLDCSRPKCPGIQLSDQGLMSISRICWAFEGHIVEMSQEEVFAVPVSPWGGSSHSLIQCALRKEWKLSERSLRRLSFRKMATYHLYGFMIAYGRSCPLPGLRSATGESMVQPVDLLN